MHAVSSGLRREVCKFNRIPRRSVRNIAPGISRERVGIHPVCALWGGEEGTVLHRYPMSGNLHFAAHENGVYLENRSIVLHWNINMSRI